ncbi:alpha/beta hydrolase [Saccharopolyspora sp. CA-218241]|uniref:alpha/beta hydrolase n=1 Tax=Saccharopolyspora sp. CA-218241 TaxID=3240027 RepID=UPI003D954514
MQRSTALGLIAATVLATCPAAQAAPALHFGPCPEDVSTPYPELRCAGLDVPLDHADPAAGTVRLLISRLPARDPAARRGALLTNPGGPGGPGIAFAGSLSRRLPDVVLNSYDLIGVDIRHTAHSTPIHCVDAATYWRAPLPDPDAEAARERNWRRAAEYAAGCAQRAGRYLPHLTTPTIARDLDLVREALGEQRISFLGYSWGTYLGAVYGRLFPHRVDRMVLDSVVDPSRVWYANNLTQDVAVQRRLGRYFDWVARHHGTFGLGADRERVGTAWRAVRAELRHAPRGPLGPSELIGITFTALYGEDDWIRLAEALAAFHLRGDDRPLVGMVVPKDAATENANAIYNAVECADAPWPADRATWERDAAALARHSPLAAWYNLWSVAPCRTWPAPSGQPVRITGAGLPPVLLLNSVHDVATPYAGALRMHRALPSSVLVTERDSGTHGLYAMAGSAEIDRIGTDYLVRGSLPAGDVAVPGHPKPDPAAPGPPRGRQLVLR